MADDVIETDEIKIPEVEKTSVSVEKTSEEMEQETLDELLVDDTEIEDDDGSEVDEDSPQDEVDSPPEVDVDETEVTEEVTPKQDEVKVDEVKDKESTKLEDTPVSADETSHTSFDEIKKTYEENKQKLEQEVALNHYNLSDDQQVRLDDGDVTLLPELMAKVYTDATTSAVSHMISQFPRLIEEALQNRETTNNNEQVFFKQWPQLNVKDHGDTIQHFGNLYRQMNPQASPEEFIRDVGAQTIVALKLETGVKTETPKVEEVKPFQPASAGGTTMLATPTNNPFEQMASEFEAEDIST